MVKVTEADQNLADWFARRMEDGEGYKDIAARLIARHRILARKEALEEAAGYLMFYHEDGLADGVRNLANEVE